MFVFSPSNDAPHILYFINDPANRSFRPFRVLYQPPSTLVGATRDDFGSRVSPRPRSSSVLATDRDRQPSTSPCPTADFTPPDTALVSLWRVVSRLSYPSEYTQFLICVDQQPRLMPLGLQNQLTPVKKRRVMLLAERARFGCTPRIADECSLRGRARLSVLLNQYFQVPETGPRKREVNVVRNDQRLVGQWLSIGRRGL